MCASPWYNPTVSVAPGSSAGSLVPATLNEARSPAVQVPLLLGLNGPVGPPSKPVAAKNGTGGW